MALLISLCSVLIFSRPKQCLLCALLNISSLKFLERGPCYIKHASPSHNGICRTALVHSSILSILIF